MWIPGFDVFSGQGIASVFNSKVSAIHQKISFASPKGKHGGHDDDDSCIESQRTLVRREIFRHTASKKSRAPVEAKVIIEDDVSTETEDEDWDDNAMDKEEASYTSKVSRLHKEVAQLNNIVKGIAQTQ